MNKIGIEGAGATVDAVMKLTTGRLVTWRMVRRSPMMFGTMDPAVSSVVMGFLGVIATATMVVTAALISTMTRSRSPSPQVTTY